MDREDRRRFFIIGSVFMEIVTPLFRTRLKYDFQTKGFGSLCDFLKSNAVVHTLFHLRFRNAYCCTDQTNCSNRSSLPLNYSQWDLLYAENPGPDIHACYCKYTAKDIKLDDLDITLLGLIVLNCCKLSPIDQNAIQMLRQYKNDFLSHNTTASISQEEYDHVRVELLTSILQLDPSKQDDFIRIMCRPLDEALCNKYLINLLDIHKKLEELDVNMLKLEEKIKFCTNTPFFDEMASLTSHLKQMESQVNGRIQKSITPPTDLFLKIKGKAQTKEREHYLQVLALFLGDRIPIIQAYIEQVVLKERCTTFEMFLNEKKHIIFHEYTPNKECCECSKLSIASALKRPSLCTEDFLMLYDQTEGKHSHFIRRNNKIFRHCICNIAAKTGICIDVVNTDVANMLLKKFAFGSFQHLNWLQEIKQMTSFLMDNGNREIEELRFKNYWSILKSAFLGFAMSTSTDHYRYVNMQLDFLHKLNQQTSEKEQGPLTNILGSLYFRSGIKKRLSEDCREDSNLTNQLLSKMLYLNFSLGIDVVHAFFETEHLKNIDLYNYLKTIKHFMFHHYKPHVLCCECTVKHVGFKSLNKRQFKKLYHSVSTSCCGKNDPERECICTLTPIKSCSINDLDIFVISTIFDDTSPPIKILKDVSIFLLVSLRETNSTHELLYEKWQVLVKSVIDIAKSVDSMFGEDIQQHITALNLNDAVNYNEKTILLEFNASLQKIWRSTNSKAEAKNCYLPSSYNFKMPNTFLPEVEGPWKGKLCESCEFRSIKVIASVGCLVCDQSLCQFCLDHHKATEAFQDHQIVPLDKYMQLPGYHMFICDKHNLQYTFFCSSHDVPLCLQCIPNDHKTCTVILMTEAVEQFKTYRLASLKRRTEVLQKAVKSVCENTETDLNSYYQRKSKFILDFDKKFKLSIQRLKIQFLGNLEVNKRTSEDIMTKLTNQKDILKTISTELPSDASPMNNFETMNKVIDMEKKLTEQENIFKELESRKNLMSTELEITFDLNTSKNIANEFDNTRDTENLKSIQVESFRSHKTDDIMNFHLEKESTFTLPKAKKENQIRGCAILDDNTACFGDRGNNRLIFMTTKGYLREIKLPSAPVDIACINGTQIAVTLYDSKSIKLFDTEKWEWGEFIFKDKHGLTGIAFGDELIIVRTGGTGYCLLNLNGKPNYTIPKPDSNMPYVACAKDKFYSAKWDTNEVYCFDKFGKTIWRFKDESIINPANGVSADIDGNVYVTGSYSNSVAVISADGKKWKQLINASRNLDNPIAIDYHKTNNKLLVSAASGYAVLYSVIRI